MTSTKNEENFQGEKFTINETIGRSVRHRSLHSLLNGELPPSRSLGDRHKNPGSQFLKQLLLYERTVLPNLGENSSAQVSAIFISVMSIVCELMMMAATLIDVSESTNIATIR